MFVISAIPLLMNGVKSNELQPLLLLEYGDQKYTYRLPINDPRYYKQAYLDQFYFNYTTPNLYVLPTLLEKTGNLRKIYIDTIVNDEKCIPVWFDTPRDFGIRFTCILKDKALLVVCNTKYMVTYIYMLTPRICSVSYHLKWNNTDKLSTQDAYLHDISLDMFQNIPLDFAPGEVKFIEFT